MNRRTSPSPLACALGGALVAANLFWRKEPSVVTVEHQRAKSGVIVLGVGQDPPKLVTCGRDIGSRFDLAVIKATRDQWHFLLQIDRATCEPRRHSSASLHRRELARSMKHSIETRRYSSNQRRRPWLGRRTSVRAHHNARGCNGRNELRSSVVAREREKQVPRNMPADGLAASTTPLTSEQGPGEYRLPHRPPAATPGGETAVIVL